MGAPRKWIRRDKVCGYCGKTFRAETVYQITKQIFCSRKCRTAVHGNGRKTKSFTRLCKKCGKALRVTPCHAETRTFCSTSCSSQYHNQGPGNPAWKGGKSCAGKYWKRKARERDNFQCQFPGCSKHGKGNVTHAHHKIPCSIGGEHSLENLITLCSKHHRELENQLLKQLVQTHPEESKEIIKKLFENELHRS